MSVVVSVRLPDALLRDVKKTLKHQHYTSLNEFIVSGVRNELYRFIEPPAVKEVRKAREEMWQEALVKAGGDEDKAIELELERIKKLELFWPEYLKAKPLPSSD